MMNVLQENYSYSPATFSFPDRNCSTQFARARVKTRRKLIQGLIEAENQIAQPKKNRIKGKTEVLF